jgi:hypothetical protein
MQVLLPPTPVGARFGLLPVRSPLLGKSLTCFLFLRVLRCFSSPRLLSRRSIPVNRDGLPHSDICGSSLVCSSPQLIAALHVLHRLCMPRHPPCALSMLLLYGLHGVSARTAYISIHAIGLIVGRMGTNLTRLPWRSTLAPIGTNALLSFAAYRNMPHQTFYYCYCFHHVKEPALRAEGVCLYER